MTTRWWWYKEYLGPDELAGFNVYKYNCLDTSPLSNYIMHPFWNWAVRLCPMWLAPNLLTFMGFLCCIIHYLIPAIFDYDFRASQLPSEHHVPPAAWMATGVFLLLSHTLDGIDGKQARRTGSSSPLGELFDHGCDAWSTVFIASTFYSIFGRNEDGYSIPVIEMYLIQWTVFFCFHSSHWEKYNTGVMYLPWGYDMAMVAGTILYMVTSLVGYDMWKIKLAFGLTPGMLMALAMAAGAYLFSLPVTLFNIYLSYRNESGKMRPFLEAIRPMVSFMLAFAICLTWALLSRNAVLEADVRCFFYLSGTIYANMSCRLIVAQMTNTRCELVNYLLLPLVLVTGAALLLPGVSVSIEMGLLYSLTLLVTLVHLHYAICVVIQMCQHLKINCFSIKNFGQERLLDSKDNDDDDADDDEDDEDQHIAMS